MVSFFTKPSYGPPGYAGRHGTKSARAWAEGQARGPLRHGTGTWAKSARHATARARLGPEPGRRGLARWASILVAHKRCPAPKARNILLILLINNETRASTEKKQEEIFSYN